MIKAEIVKMIFFIVGIFLCKLQEIFKLVYTRIVFPEDAHPQKVIKSYRVFPF